VSALPLQLQGNASCGFFPLKPFLASSEAVLPLQKTGEAGVQVEARQLQRMQPLPKPLARSKLIDDYTLRVCVMGRSLPPPSEQFLSD